MKQQQFGMDKGRARNLRSLCIIALEKKVEQAFQACIKGILDIGL